MSFSLNPGSTGKSWPSDKVWLDISMQINMRFFLLRLGLESFDDEY